MKSKKTKAITLAICIVILMGLSGVASAQISIVGETGKSDAIFTGAIGDLSQFIDTTVKGGLAVVADGGFTPSSVTYDLDLKIPAGATVQNAYLYTVFYKLDKTGEYKVVFDGNNLGDARNNVIGEPNEYQQNCRFDVTKYVGGSKVYKVNLNKVGGDTSVYGATLVVIYEQTTGPSTRIIINDGCVYIGKGDSYTTNFKGIVSTGKTASLWVVASGTNKGESDKLYFNGNLLGTDVFNESTGRMFDTDKSDVSSYLKTDNVVKFDAIGDPFWADVAILAVSSESAPPKIAIKTDKFKYHPGDKMHITIGISNPTKQPVTFKWFLGVPTFGFWMSMYKGEFPPGFEHTFEVPFPIEAWEKEPFSAVWYVDLQDPETGQELVADCACWSYCPLETHAMPTMSSLNDIRIEGIA